MKSLHDYLGELKALRKRVRQWDKLFADGIVTQDHARLAIRACMKHYGQLLLGLERLKRYGPVPHANKGRAAQTQPGRRNRPRESRTPGLRNTRPHP